MVFVAQDKNGQLNVEDGVEVSNLLQAAGHTSPVPYEHFKRLPRLHKVEAPTRLPKHDKKRGWADLIDAHSKGGGSDGGGGAGVGKALTAAQVNKVIAKLQGREQEIVSRSHRYALFDKPAPCWHSPRAPLRTTAAGAALPCPSSDNPGPDRCRLVGWSADAAAGVGGRGRPGVARVHGAAADGAGRHRTPRRRRHGPVRQTALLPAGLAWLALCLLALLLALWPLTHNRLLARRRLPWQQQSISPSLSRVVACACVRRAGLQSLLQHLHQQGGGSVSTNFAHHADAPTAEEEGAG